MDLGTKIKEARQAAGLSRSSVKTELKIPERTLANWENGITKPSEWVAELVINALNRIKITPPSVPENDSLTTYKHLGHIVTIKPYVGNFIDILINANVKYRVLPEILPYPQDYIVTYTLNQQTYYAYATVIDEYPCVYITDEIPEDGWVKLRNRDDEFTRHETRVKKVWSLLDNKLGAEKQKQCATLLEAMMCDDEYTADDKKRLRRGFEMYGITSETVDKIGAWDCDRKLLDEILCENN